MMPESLMDEEEAAPSRPNEGPAGEEKHGEGPSVLVNAELCPEAQVGDRLIVEVIKHHGEELEVRYEGKEGEGGEGEKPGEEPTAEPAMPRGESLMD